jgi:hypothetical protein
MAGVAGVAAGRTLTSAATMEALKIMNHKIIVFSLHSVMLLCA